MKNNWFRLLILCFITANIFITVRGQFFQTGQEPASVHWEQINTPNFQIIFPSEFNSQANHLANTLEYLYVHVSASLGRKPRKISVILHSRSSKSNGLVTWAPKRMELYTTPPQETYAQDWMDQLAVHELRHVVQIDEMDKGIFQIFSLIFGEQLTGGLAGLLPGWLFEGDAVNNETVLTSTGRGRDASFTMVMKASVLEHKKLFSYNKALLGSYKDFVPDRYELGYPLVAWTREHLASEGKDSDLNFFGRYPTPVFVIPFGLPKVTGYCTKCLYQSAFTDLKKRWESKLAQLPPDRFRTWNIHTGKTYTSYQLPQIVNDTTLLVVKSGIDELTSIILLYKSGKEKKLYTCGEYAIDQLSYAKGQFVFAEEIPDLRWSNQSYYCIRKGNIETGNVYSLTRKSRLFAPALSPDGSRIVAVDVNLKNEYSLKILNASNGALITGISIPDNRFPQLPVWSSDGKSIYLLLTGKKGKSLQQYQLSEQTWNELIAPGFTNITDLYDAGTNILFSGQYNGISNIYAYNKSKKTIREVTDVKFGAFSPVVSKHRKLILSEYTSQGYRVVSSSYDPDKFKPMDQLKNRSIGLYKKGAQLEHFNFQDSIVPNTIYPVSHYSKAGHLINIHSWSPFYCDYTNLSMGYTTITPGLTLLSQNMLSTLVSDFGYSYQNHVSHWIADLIYQGWYPVIDFSVDYGGSVPIDKPGNLSATPGLNFNRLTLRSKIYVPLNFSRGKYISGITPGINLNYQDNWFYQPEQMNFINGVIYAGFFLNAYKYYKTSLRDINPKWGAILNAQVITTPDNPQLNNIFYILGRVYAPGILKHQSLSITAGYQEQSPANYLFSTQLSFPRGISPVVTNKLNTLSVDYTFPIFYPDLAIGPVLYFKRIQGNLFYNVARNQYKNSNSEWSSDYLSSRGFDLTTDFHLFRIAFPINSGVRVIYLPQSRTYTSEFLFRIDLNNF